MSSDQRRRLLVSWSGGKDSALALAALAAEPDVEIIGLLTSVTRGYDRVSIHGVRRVLLEAQAKSLRLPLTEIPIDPECTNQAYEAAFLDATQRAYVTHGSIDGIVFGDLFLEDVRRYRERLLAGTGLPPVFPLWGVSTDVLAARCIASGIDARLVCVDTTQLDASFAGRAYDGALLVDLPPTVDPCGERGEFHTFVGWAPGFHEPVPYGLGDVVRRNDRFVYCDLLPASPITAHPGAHPATAEAKPRGAAAPRPR